MTMTAPYKTPQPARRGNATTERATAIKRGYKARLRRGDLLETIVYFSAAIVLALFLADGGATYFINIKDVATGLGIVTGLIGNNMDSVWIIANQ